MYLMWLLSCTGNYNKAPVELCESSVEVRYDPLRSTELLAFPDDYLRFVDPDSPTGHRLDFSAERAPWSTELPAIFRPILDDAETRSGFARLGSVALRFSAAVEPGPTDPIDAIEDAGIIWLDLSVSPPERVAYTSWLDEDGDQMMLKPLVPLRARARHAVFITNQHQSSEGECLAPSSSMRAILKGHPESELETHAELIDSAIEDSGLERSSLSHVQVFTTQDDLEMMVDVAHDIQTQSYAWLEEPICEGESSRSCVGVFMANDYRSGEWIISPTPKDQWPLTVRFWLPAQGDAPLAVYGHGINSQSTTGSQLASIANPLGIAVVATDAMHHGVHPTADPDSAMPALNFLGVNLSELAFDTQNLRGSFDQTIADRLQLLELLAQEPDVDGDGIDDLDLVQLIYYGDSLGGMLGPQLLANHSGFDATVLAIAGGDLPVFTTDTAEMENYQSLIEALIGPPDRFDRLTPVLQTMVDASDPAVWARHVMTDRFDNATAPSVLFPVCDTDTDVPPAAAKALARALGIPHLAPVIESVPMLEVVGGPLQGNLVSGSTGAYFQLNRVSSDQGVIASTHGNVPYSPEGRWLTGSFLESFLAGSAVIADPYAALGTAELE